MSLMCCVLSLHGGSDLEGVPLAISFHCGWDYINHQLNSLN